MWTDQYRRSAAFNTVDLQRETLARARNGVYVPKTCCFFIAVENACLCARHVRANPRLRARLGSPDREPQKLSICIEKPRRARAFRACAPETCGLLALREPRAVPHGPSGPAPVRSRTTSRGPDLRPFAGRAAQAPGARAAPRLPCEWSSGTGQSERLGRRLRAAQAGRPTACRWCSPRRAAAEPPVTSPRATVPPNYLRRRHDE